MAFQLKIGVKEKVTRRLYRNNKWKEYLDSLPNDDDRKLACEVMDWIKWFLREDYPDVSAALDGDLIWEKTSGDIGE